MDPDDWNHHVPGLQWRHRKTAAMVQVGAPCWRVSWPHLLCRCSPNKPKPRMNYLKVIRWRIQFSNRYVLVECLNGIRNVVTLFALQLSPIYTHTWLLVWILVSNRLLCCLPVTVTNSLVLTFVIIYLFSPPPTDSNMGTGRGRQYQVWWRIGNGWCRE